MNRIYLSAKKKKVPHQRGVAIIEFVIAVPVLILLLMILFECGRLYSVYMRFTEITWEGTRFFSSLNKPPQACLSSKTTNLCYVRGESAYYASLTNQADKDVYVFHRTVQERVLALLNYNPSTWPLESDGLIPSPDGGTYLLKDSQDYKNMPTISTQFVGEDDLTTTGNDMISCPPPNGGTTDLADLENTVSVCLEATYKGMFFDIPIHTCSTSHLLENNENFSIPNLPSSTRSTVTSGRSGRSP